MSDLSTKSVRLHVNKAGRRHVLGHARALYEGARFDFHRVAKDELDQEE
jgi:hypothetical protein